MIFIKYFQIILTDMPRNLQIILRFSLIFYDILQFSLNFSVFLRIFAPENPLPVKKGCGVIIFIKVLKNDEALPSEMDSRAFFFGDQRWNRWERG